MLRYIINIYSLFLLTTAIFVHLLVIQELKENELNPDVKSAIKRARTSDCKNEFINFAYLSNTNAKGAKLSRTCKHDQHQERHIRKGCSTNTSSGVIRISEKVDDLISCLELCFSYKHSYGGLESTLDCYCGDEDSYMETKTCSSAREFDWYHVNSGTFKPSAKSFPVSKRKDTKIAFLFVLSGKLISQVERLFKLLYSVRHIYYFHIDNVETQLYKYSLQLQKKHSNIILAKERYRTVWGSPFLLQVIINSMVELTTHDWDYLINLSESDFPLKSLTEIENYLSNSNLIYLKSHNIKGYHFIRKQGLNKLFYQCEDRVWRLGTRSLPIGIIYVGGSDWFVLPKDFCDYIVNSRHDSKSLVKPLLQLYNFTLLPAESFFHTVASNTEYCDRFANNNLRLTNWNSKVPCKCKHKDVVDWCGCSPLVYTQSDKDKLKQASLKPDILFTRKFDQTVDSEIINYVESHLLHDNFTSG